MHDPAHLTNPSINKRLPKTPSMSVDILDEYSALSNSSDHGVETSPKRSRGWNNFRTGLNHHWKPCTQTVPFLLTVFLASVALIIFLQLALARSNRDSGIIFATNINDLPLSSSFSYLYLPTIIALIFSFMWTWMDLDTKRLQPFLQLSRSGGARGDDSVLLHYPFDFVAFVPFKAMRRRHWPVFSASFAVVIIFWGLTPLQSSIFATKTVTRTEYLSMAPSIAYLSIEQQNTLLTGSYVQSVYNIAWLNETLPSYMTRQGMLAPFGLVQKLSSVHTAEAWTGQTKLYSVDVLCQTATQSTDGYKSYNGCDYYGGMGIPPNISNDQYATQYLGYWYQESMDMYLSQYCPASANRTFFAQWYRGQMNESTSLFCESSYYQQYVNATVVPPHMTVADIVPVGSKMPLPADLFNITDFEWGMSDGQQAFQNRGSFPTSQWPDATERLSYLDLAWQDDYVPNMVAFAISAYQAQAADYMDPLLLADSYQAAYRLLFARRMADILSKELDLANQSTGIRTYQTQAVTLVSDFVYIVEALLAITAIAALTLLYTSFTTASNLRSNPANLASIMAFTAQDSRIISLLSGKDRTTSSVLHETLKNGEFALMQDDQLSAPDASAYSLRMIKDSSTPEQDLVEDASGVSEPLQTLLPKELSGLFIISFLVIQTAIFVTLVYLYLHAEAQNGLALPSSSLFINQAMENYVPMIVAAFFEPIWVVVNRLICMLQPFEQLRKGNSHPSSSLLIDYNSLPPQAMIGKALRAGHVYLAMVCMMALLANVLSVAFSSLLFQNSVNIARLADFNQPFQIPFNGETLGNVSFSEGQPVYDQFYVAVSNLTAGTPLPPWTDEEFFYVPFVSSSTVNSTSNLSRASTRIISASLDCISLGVDGLNTVTYDVNDGFIVAANVSFNGEEPCYINETTVVRGDLTNNSALEVYLFGNDDWDWAKGEFVQGNYCNNTIVAGWIRTGNRSTSVHGQIQDSQLNSSWTACRPNIQTGSRTVTVDSDGYVQASFADNVTHHDLDGIFQPNASSFFMSVHKLLGQADMHIGPTWHEDSYPSDFISYLLATTMNSSEFLDPAVPPPSLNETAPAFGALYSKLFAIIVGTNYQKILQQDQGQSYIITGSTIAPETRIFFSKSMFIMSVVILSLYIIATIVVYLRRPWKVLPRMPTTIASQMAFFAASHMLEDMKGTADMTARERDGYVKGLGRRYGFGRFVGTDGKVHVGIEREPLVQVLKKQDLKK